MNDTTMDSACLKNFASYVISINVSCRAMTSIAPTVGLDALFVGANLVFAHATKRKLEPTYG
jgi:hypothetical protein